jgi:hypothetical protein
MRPIRFLLLVLFALNLIACGSVVPVQPTATVQAKPQLPTKPALATPANSPVAKPSPVTQLSPVAIAPTPMPVPVSSLAVATLPDGKIGLRGEASALTQKGGTASGASSANTTKQSNIAFILDASGSMTTKLPNSSQTRIQVAKQVMSELVTQVPSNVKAALWFYGHRLPQEPKDKSCKDIERVFALGAVNASAYTQAIQKVNTLGYTPIADSLTLAAKDLPAGDNQNNTIILVSDGEETCGGDPCKVAEALKASNSRVTIHVVGYNVEEVARKQLQCVANASGGMYRDAASADLLREALTGALQVADAKTFLRLETVGPNNVQVKTKFALYKVGAKDLIAGYNAWADNPVTPGVYDIVIETLPRMIYSNVNITEGSTTLIRLNVGAFEFASVAGESPNPYSVQLVDPANKADLGYSLNPGTEPYYVLPGTFNLQLYPSVSQGTPSAVFVRTEIKPLEKITLKLGAFDLRGVNNDSVRPYSIAFYDATTNQQIVSITGAAPKLYYLAPGPYRVELFYSVTAYPQSMLNNLVIKPGETNTFTLGAYVVKDATNKTVNPEHTVTDAASGQQIASFSGYSPARYYVPPGTYNLKFSGGEVKNVVIVGGKEITVQAPK